MIDHSIRSAARPTAADLTDSQFRAISSLVYSTCGINLQEGKQGLVKTRLAKRLLKTGSTDFDDYLAYVERDQSGQELIALLDVISTNKTSFFREAQHFDFIRRVVLPEHRRRGGGLRIWSAGCSSGEEPYSIAIQMQEELGEPEVRDVRILATDLSTQVLERAQNGVYEAATVAEVPPPLVQRYFGVERTEPTRAYRVDDRTRSMVRFARLNLMESWPMRGPFDLILCRNVMIYFDRPTQQRLVQRFWELLRPGGHLFVGHSESLTSMEHPFRYVQPAVYEK